jgi:hypothetical protein
LRSKGGQGWEAYGVEIPWLLCYDATNFTIVSLQIVARGNMHPFYGLKLSVQQNLCEGYWLKYNASAKGGCYRNYHVSLANFDVMTHLVVHLIKELDICGPIHTKWMHPIERYMKAL